jgi:hypothetical protein
MSVNLCAQCLQLRRLRRTETAIPMGTSTAAANGCRRPPYPSSVIIIEVASISAPGCSTAHCSLLSARLSEWCCTLASRLIHNFGMSAGSCSGDHPRSPNGSPTALPRLPLFGGGVNDYTSFLRPACWSRLDLSNWCASAFWNHGPPILTLPSWQMTMRHLIRELPTPSILAPPLSVGHDCGQCSAHEVDATRRCRGNSPAHITLTLPCLTSR